MNDTVHSSIIDPATQRKVALSQQYFNRATLSIYDFILYGLISRYAWGVSVQRLDAHYRKYASDNHLEVGVGTGYLLNRVKFGSSKPRLSLMDLSLACLATTKRKLARYTPDTYEQNLLEPIGHKLPSYDSIAINYVLHCVPGAFSEKGLALQHLQNLLSKNGVLFGATVLSKDIRKNLLARPFMWLMNTLGVFNNREDSAKDLKDFLFLHFDVLEFEVRGVTALFALRARA